MLMSANSHYLHSKNHFSYVNKNNINSQRDLTAILIFHQLANGLLVMISRDLALQSFLISEVRFHSQEAREQNW